MLVSIKFEFQSATGAPPPPSPHSPQIKFANKMLTKMIEIQHSVLSLSNSHVPIERPAL